MLNFNFGDLEEQSDLGLHCLPRPICLKTWDHYGRSIQGFGGWY